MVNLTVTRRPFQSPVALAISSPTSAGSLAVARKGECAARSAVALYQGVRTLGRETERTDLGGESGGGTDFTTGRTEVDDLDLGGIELGSCSGR